jgi:hypothetical protein
MIGTPCNIGMHAPQEFRPFFASYLKSGADLGRAAPLTYELCCLARILSPTPTSPNSGATLGRGIANFCGGLNILSGRCTLFCGGPNFFKNVRDDEINQAFIFCEV